MDNKNEGFSSPFLQEAINALSEEDKERYQKMGNYMLSKMEKNLSGTKSEPPTAEVLVYIENGLKSGLHPKDLLQKELQVMFEQRGDKWFEEYGYTEDEVPKPTISIGDKPVGITDKMIKKALKKEDRKKLKKANRGKNIKKLLRR